MKKNKLYIFFPFMILAIFFIIAGTCKGEPPSEEEKWKKEVSQAVKDIQKEQTAAALELIEQVELIPVTLKGSVTSEATQDIISITIDRENGRVEGEITLWWYEEIEDNGEGSEEHHSHLYTCVVKLQGGFIFGTIDENDNIYAKISGSVYSDYGYPESGQSTPEICYLCRDKIEKKQADFILEGKYQEDIMFATGNVLPKGWSWSASK